MTIYSEKYESCMQWMSSMTSFHYSKVVFNFFTKYHKQNPAPFLTKEKFLLNFEYPLHLWKCIRSRRNINELQQIFDIALSHMYGYDLLLWHFIKWKIRFYFFLSPYTLDFIRTNFKSCMETLIVALILASNKGGPYGP